MKVLGVCAVILAFASVVTAGFFTPKPSSKDDVTIDKEGVVVGIEKDGGNTKVSVSPHEADDEKGFFAEAMEKMKKASSFSANQEEEKEEETHHKVRPGEVVCDALGKCREKVESYMEGTKEVAANGAAAAAEEAVRVAKDKAHKVKKSLKDAASEVARKGKDKVGKKGSELEEGAKRGIFGVMGSGGGVLHLLGSATAYGMCVWVTFASDYLLAKALSRQQFAMVQSKIYPLYFKAMASSVGMALLGNVMGRGRRFSPFGLGGFDLLAPLVMTLVNLIYLEPRAAKVMIERMKKEKEEGRGASVPTGGGTGSEGEKREEAAAVEAKNMGSSGTHLLRRLNSWSSLLNAATLMSLTWHLVQLGHHLHAVC